VINRRFAKGVREAAFIIVVVLVLVFLYAPTSITFIMSFDPRGYAANFPPVGFTLKWYESFLSDPTLLLGLRNSLIIAAASMVLSLIVAVPPAYIFVRHSFAGKEVLTTLFLSPLIVPGIIAGVALLTFFSSIGFLNSFPNLIIGHVIITFPYVFRVVIASLTGFDRSVEEASLSLGASWIQTLANVTLPLISPALVAGAVMTFAVSMDDLSVSLFLSDTQSFTLPVVLFSLLRAMFSPVIAAASTVLMVGTFVVIAVVEKTVGLDKLLALYQ